MCIQITTSIFAIGYVQTRNAWEDCIRERRAVCSWNAAYRHWS